MRTVVYQEAKYFYELNKSDSAICFFCGEGGCAVSYGEGEDTERYWLCNDCHAKLNIIFYEKALGEMEQYKRNIKGVD